MLCKLPPLSPWHSVLFRDTNANTYYCPRLIRQDITKIGLLTHQLQHTLPPTWAPVYQAALAAPFEAPTGTPPQETLLAFWTKWNTRVMLRYLISQVPPPPVKHYRHGPHSHS